MLFWAVLDQFLIFISILMSHIDEQFLGHCILDRRNTIPFTVIGTKNIYFFNLDEIKSLGTIQVLHFFLMFPQTANHCSDGLFIALCYVFYITKL